MFVSLPASSAGTFATPSTSLSMTRHGRIAPPSLAAGWAAEGAWRCANPVEAIPKKSTPKSTILCMIILQYAGLTIEISGKRWLDALPRWRAASSEASPPEEDLLLNEFQHIVEPNVAQRTSPAIDFRRDLRPFGDV